MPACRDRPARAAAGANASDPAAARHSARGLRRAGACRPRSRPATDWRGAARRCPPLGGTGPASSRIAVAEAQDTGEAGCLRAKGRSGGGEVRAAVGKAAVLARRIADAAPVVAEHGPPAGRDPLREQGHAPMRSDPQLVAARNDEQPGAARRRVQRRGKPLASAGELDQAPRHVRTQSAISAASACASAGSASGSARRQGGG